MRTKLFRLARFARAIAGSTLLLCATAHAGTIAVTHGWIRALPAGIPSGGYFELANDTDKPIVLTGASSPACGMLMLHKTDDESGMAGMRDVATIPIAAGVHFSFAPGNYHLMCMNATSAIKPGNKVPVTLVFSGGVKITSEFEVRNATGH